MLQRLNPIALALLFATALVAQERSESDPVSWYRTLSSAKLAAQAGDWQTAAEHYGRLYQQNKSNMAMAWDYAQASWLAGEGESVVGIGIAAMEAGFGQRRFVAFSLARSLASGEAPEQAIHWIKQALAWRYENRPELRTDEAFAALRDNAEFQRLAGSPPDGEFSRQQRWAFDLDYYLDEVQRLHVHPDGRGQSEGFSDRVEALKQRVPSLDDAAIVMELQKITATLGDGHSAIYPIGGKGIALRFLPVQFYFFSDGLYVIAGEADQRELIGARVTAIGGKPVNGIKTSLESYVSRDNQQGILWLGPTYLRATHVLRDLGFTNSLDKAELQVTMPSGESRVVTLYAIHPSFQNKLSPPPQGGAPRWLKDVDNSFWHEPIAAHDAVYVQFNQVNNKDGQSIGEFAREVRATVADADAKHLIIDVRHNNGGNNFRHWPMLGLVQWHELQDEDHRVWVITGRNTFSACQNFINFVDRGTGATFVGEPSSSKPNFVGESTSLLLPFSGIRGSISSRYWQDSFPEDRRPYIPVELPVTLSFDDWWNNRDPVLAALFTVIEEGAASAN